MMNSLPKLKKSSGQTLLVVVLIISVSLIISLSVISRTITDVTVTNKEEESQRAFSAAEAGIEKSLLSGNSITTPTNLTNASFTTNVSNFSQGISKFVNPTLLNSGESMTVWFVAHNADGSMANTSSFAGTKMNVCWNGDTAIEVTVYYTSDGSANLANMQLFRAAFDANVTRGDNFAGVDLGTPCSIGNNNFDHQKLITLPTPIAGLKFAKVKVLYNVNPVDIGIDSTDNNTFPSQGVIIDSTGSACTGSSCTTSDSNRKITVVEGYNEVPSVFDSTIYGGTGGLTK
jgi:Tfp pilus assembly protein PilX